MSEEDAKPWYRQFWPWFIICLPASAVIASLYTVSLAVRTTDSLVVTSEDGMDIVTERHLSAERRARDLGLRARLQIDPTSGALLVTVVASKPVEWPKTLELLLSHPTLAHRDRAVMMTAALPDADGNPTWSGHLLDVPGGRWYVVLNDGDNWRLNGSWSGSTDIDLLPAGADDDGNG